MREKRRGKRFLAWALVLMMVLSLLPMSALAEDGEAVVYEGGGETEKTPTYAAKIGETAYKTLDEAIEAALDGATIVLQADCTTAGMNLSKNLTIDGGSDKHKIEFNDKGIALWGKALRFQNCNIVMTGIGSTPYTAEWSWMAILRQQRCVPDIGQCNHDDGWYECWKRCACYLFLLR